MHEVLISFATVAGVVIGLILYGLVGNELGANIGLVVGIAVITANIYLIKANHL